MSTAFGVNFNAVFTTADNYFPFNFANTDLTGSTFRMTVRDNTKNILRTFTLENGFEVIDAAKGSFALRIPYSVSSTFPVGIYQHDLLYTSQGGIVTRIWHGTFCVRAGVTTP